jgi:hypothetical protein
MKYNGVLMILLLSWELSMHPLKDFNVAITVESSKRHFIS